MTRYSGKKIVSNVDIGDVTILNAAGTPINPATSEAQAAMVAAVEPYAALHPGSLEMTSSAVGLFPAWSGAVEYTEGGIVVIAETGKVYLALQTGTNQTPASQPLFWRELTLRGALLEAPSGNSDDIMWGTLISQNQTFSPGDKIILKITTAAIVSLRFDGDSPDVVNYVIFE